jgi:hypothetical protein
MTGSAAAACSGGAGVTIELTDGAAVRLVENTWLLADAYQELATMHYGVVKR